LNDALLSRLRVLSLKPLDEKALELLLKRYESQKGPLPLTEGSRKLIIFSAQGDGRFLLNLIENLQGLTLETPLDEEGLQIYLQRRSALYDRQGDQHYNMISALHKSIRGSDPDAALYWFARMLEGSEDPLFLARRMIRMASEDVGLADPQALQLCIAARDAYDMLGSPEGELALAEAVVYLALAPKSNAIYKAYGEARDLASKTTQMSPPAIILNAPTKLMKQMGYGKGYQYDHDVEDAFSGQNYFPDGIERREFYEPVERGFEREMKKRKDYFNKKRNKI
jgi:putative ATPase